MALVAILSDLDASTNIEIGTLTEQQVSTSPRSSYPDKAPATQSSSSTHHLVTFEEPPIRSPKLALYLGHPLQYQPQLSRSPHLCSVQRALSA